METRAVPDANRGFLHARNLPNIRPATDAKSGLAPLRRCPRSTPVRGRGEGRSPQHVHADPMTARHRISKLQLRPGLIYSGGAMAETERYAPVVHALMRAEFRFSVSPPGWKSATGPGLTATALAPMWVTVPSTPFLCLPVTGRRDQNRDHQGAPADGRWPRSGPMRPRSSRPP